METVKIKIKDLMLDPKNAKIHTSEQIEKIINSINQFGMNDPIAVWGKKNMIIEGHGRVQALTKMGIEEVDAIRLDHLNNEQRQAYAIAHNATNMLTGFDENILNEIMLELDGFDFSSLGVQVAEAEAGAEKEAEEDEYEIPEEIEIKVKLGDVWQLGRHRLMCGDSTKKEDVEKLMYGNLADIVLTDPPYNVAIKNSQGMTIKNDDMGDAEFLEFLKKLFKNMFNSLKLGGSFYIWYASREHLNFETAIRSSGEIVRQQLIWNKNSMIMGRQDYQWKHEPCLYGWKSGASHYFVDDRTQTTVIEDKGIDFKKLTKAEAVKMLQEIHSDKISTSIINEDKPNKNDLHPTMKPIKLNARLIKNSSKIDQIVLDVCGGSGSTLITCEQLDRICYMMEYDPKYATVIVDRWEKLTGQKAQKVEE